MPDILELDRARTAVLILDYQIAVVESYATDAERLLERAAAVLAAARNAGILIIHVVVEFRPGYPEISPRGSFRAVRDSGRFLAGDPGAAIHPAVAPQAGDLTVIKRRVSAFAGSDLEMILRAQQIDTLVLLGIATSGVVLSTLRYAADADFRLVLVRDCCSDRDPEVHAVLVDRVFPRQAAVLTAEEFIAALA